jgi:hypothetical protein
MADQLIQDWALWVAAVPGAMVVVVVTWLLFRKSRYGQLRLALKVHQRSLKDQDRGRRATAKAEALVRKLTAKAEVVKPRVLQEAKEALQDSRALEKIAGDRVQIAANHVRRVIHDEFPPLQHETLRVKYLPQDVRDNRPFTF